MTQTRKMQNGDKTPTLYNFFDNQYDFNDLSRRVYSGLDTYISTLKKGKKYEKEIREAVSNLMSGVGDGTIIFGNGRYNDSLGRYRNSEDKDNDIYGWAANYIYNQMNNTPKYIAPQNTEQEKGKEAWKYNSLSRALVKDIFNSTNPNIDYFVYQDQEDPTTHTRSTTARAKIISDWIDNNVNNDFFNRYSNLSDEDRQRQIELATTASNRLKDGVDSSDYLFLSRAFPNIPWDELFKQNITKEEQPQNPQQQQKETPSEDEFTNYLAQNFKRMPNDTAEFSLATPSDINYGDWTRNQIGLSIKNADYATLLTYLGTAVNNPNEEFGNLPLFRRAVGNTYPHIPSQVVAQGIISRLQQEGKLIKDPKNSNLWYIPDFFDKKTNSGYYYDASTKTIYKKNVQDLPYWVEYIRNQYNTNQRKSQSQYFTEAQYKKNGGIIKAQKGVRFSDNANWHSGVFIPQLNHILQGLKTDSNYYMWLNDMQDKHNNIYRSAGNNWQDTAYRSSLVGNYQNLYKSGYNNEWGDNTAGYNSLGIQNAQGQGMFNISGGKRTSGDWNGNGNNWNTDSLYSAITDYRRLLGREGDYTPEQLQDAISKFRNVGYDFYLDKTGYYKLRPLEYSTISNPTLELEHQDIISPEIVPSQGTIQSIQSMVYPKTPKKQNPYQSSIENIATNSLPYLIGAGRLFASLRTNNRVARTLDRSLRPVLKNTYERYSPVTGAFGEMSFRNRQAADLRRQTSKPFTSDASLQLAGQLEADRQARDLEYQGFLADDKEIKRTQEAALARQEDNMARRSDVANFNRASINQTNREKAQLEATRLKQNWQSVDNYMKNIEEQVKLNLAERRSLLQRSALQAASDLYQDALASWNKDYKATHPNATTETMLADPYYTDRVQELRRRYQYDLYNVGRGRYLRNPYINSAPREYKEILTEKKGGSLKPSTIYLINKIIKNEDNS